jgi:hypothetical protein
MVIEESKYDLLLAYIDTGANKDLPQEMIDYISILELIRGMHMRYENRQAIVKFLQQPPYSLSYYQATQRYSEAVNFFYLDHDIKKQAWRNLYAEKLDRAADLVLKTSSSAKDIDIYKNIIYAAMEARGLSRPDNEDIPKELFQKPVKIYSLDPTQLGRKRANRIDLAKHIDLLDIPEAEKQRARADAMIEDIVFLPEDEPEN